MSNGNTTQIPDKGEGKNITYETPMLRFLSEHGVQFTSKEHVSFRLVSAGFMDLVVETWINPAMVREVSVCHYGEQNGDLMRDPEILFLVNGTKEIPEYFRNDYTGIEHFNIHKTPQLAEIESFVVQWVKNLTAQHYELKQEGN